MAKVGASVPPAGAGSDVAPDKIVFVGFMGAGKSRAARAAADLTGADALDSDALIEADLGEPIESFFDREGEAVFREREQAVVLDLLERPRPAVIALGGGALGSERVRRRLRDLLCVHVSVDLDLAWQRSSDSGRPLARDRERFASLHAERTPLYRSVARAVVPAGERGLPKGALDAVLALARPQVPHSVTMRWARAASGGYPAYIGEGALGATGALWPAAGRPFLVADEAAGRHHGGRLEAALAQHAPPAGTVVVPAGERHKTLSEAERVLRALASAGMERSDCIVALGGGVTGDLAGFCAAVYQRGVAVVQVPTTLVAQVDSAYGGKTGVDIPEAKNYVGVFHQPAGVIADPGTLTTLPAEELRAGFAEVVKTALIAGGDLWRRTRELGPIEDSIRDQPEAVRELIVGCVETKLDVVSRDERDLGERAALNLGHTFAHALEAASGYVGPRHGEAVAVGLLVALRLSERELGLDPALREEVETLLRRHRLPVTFTGVAPEAIVERAMLDKKRRSGGSNFVLLRSPGEVAIGSEVQQGAFAEAIAEVAS